jgi:hypothetical protein
MCNDPIIGNKPEEVFLRSYVMEYYNFTGLNIEEGGSDSFYPEKLILLNASKGVTTCSYLNTADPYKTMYDALCEKHGDMTFNRKVYLPIDGRVVNFPAIDFVSIDVVSNVDYDAEHPAGTSLNDLFTFNGYSAKPYIDSGYAEDDIHVNEVYVYSDIVKPLEEVSSNDLVLLGTGDPRRPRLCHLAIDTYPTLSKTHTFTVTMTADDGRVFSDSIEMTFE